MDPIAIGMADSVTPVAVVFILFVILPGLVFHYLLQMRKIRSLSDKDEQTIDELYELARRVEDRVTTVERILDAETPGWNSGRTGKDK